jgi:chromosome segregation ATPase
MSGSSGSRLHDSSPRRDQKPSPEQQLFDLKKQIDFLTAENASIRRQCDEAVQVATDMDSIYSQNRQLKADIRTLKADKQELQRRLKLSLQSVAELQEQANSAQPPKHKIIHGQSEKCNHKSEIRRLRGEISGLKSGLADEELKNQEPQSSLQEILSGAERFFNERVESRSQLSELFLNTSPPESLPSSQIRWSDQFLKG